MAVATVQGIERSTLSIEENHALDLLVNLPISKFNELKELMELDVPGIIGPTTLSKFLQFCKNEGIDLSEAGVNAFKDQNGIGNTGIIRGIIGPQTAGIYFDVLTATQDFSQTGRQINDAGLKLVQEFEGFASRKFRSGQLVPDGKVAAYFDPVRIPTIGFGHTRTVTASDVDVKSITRQQAEQLLREDLADAEAAVSELVKKPLNDNQFSALVSFVFNLGAGAFKQSTMLKLLTESQYTEAANQFPRWDKAGGVQLPGLTRRRKAERELFLTP